MVIVYCLAAGLTGALTVAGFGLAGWPLLGLMLAPVTISGAVLLVAGLAFWRARAEEAELRRGFGGPMPPHLGRGRS